MKKKLVAVLLAGMMAVSSLTACGGEKKEPAPAAGDANVEKAADDTDAEEAADDADAEEAADEEMVSDETFTILQDNFALLVETYDMVAELYNSEEIAANSDIEEAMTQAAEVMAQMGEITKDSITETEAAELNDSMVTICEALGMIVEGMESAE